MPYPTSRRLQRTDSWPPTQVRLQTSIEQDDTVMEDDSDPPLMDEDPLTYFLTPTPLLEVDDDDDDVGMMDFNAGIEDENHPHDIVRSVSPSSLEGLRRPPPRPPTPPRSPPAHLSPDPESATDEEDDNEDYIRFGTGRLHTVGLPFNLRDFASMKAKRAAKTKAASTLLSPPTSHSLSVPSARGRPTARFGPSPPAARPSLRGRPRSWSGRYSPHAWREPSPDVWSIEEETEEDMNSEMGSSIGIDDLVFRNKEEDEGAGKLHEALDTPAAKPRKKVRFVLPARED